MSTVCSPVATGDSDLLARAAAWPEYPAWSDLTEEVLRDVTRREGIDFATALLYERITRSPALEHFFTRLASAPEPESTHRVSSVTVAVVPGAFYREDPRSGADGRFVLDAAATLSCHTDRIALPSFGSLAESARLITDWLRQRRGERVILVSLSKGGAEVKLALAMPDAAEVFRDVIAWVSLSGLYYGTPLLAWLTRQWWRLPLIRLLFWWRGYHYPALSELGRGPGCLLQFEMRPPEHLCVVHVVGFPLVRHLSTPLVRRGHRRISRLGPNDGGAILLADLCTLPGLIYPVWGADHYLRPVHDQKLLARLIYYLAEEHEGAAASPALRPRS